MKGPDPYFFTEQIQDSVRFLVRVETDPQFLNTDDTEYFNII